MTAPIALRTVLLVLAGLAPIMGAVLVVRLPSPMAAEPAPKGRRPASSSRPKKGGKRGGKRRR